jgi:hypothetical protein
VPVWIAGSYGTRGPLRPPARYDGFFPINLEHPDQLAELVAELTGLRRDAGKPATERFDILRLTAWD